jgi:hypothetical protein
METVPDEPSNANGAEASSDNVPIPTCGLPGGCAMRETGPFAPVGEMLMLKVTEVPWAIVGVVRLAGLVLDIVKVSGVNVAELQLLIRLLTFSEPSPVARS